METPFPLYAASLIANITNDESVCQEVDDGVIFKESFTMRLAPIN